MLPELTLNLHINLVRLTNMLITLLFKVLLLGNK